MVSSEDEKRVKGMGFLRNKGTDCFSARVITGNGTLTAAQHRHIADAAETFGNGVVTLTTRMTLEVQGIPFEQIEAFRAYLAEGGLTTGGTGAKVRPVVSCKGTTCRFGLIDTFALAEEIHRRFYEGFRETALPHKFKIAVGGCPNNCVKPDLNDLGIVGQSLLTFDPDVCKGCKKCSVAEACPMHAAKVRDGVLVRDEDLCNHCGRCREICRFGALKSIGSGYKIYIGGRWGKCCERGRALNRIFTDREEVLALIERTIRYYRENGRPGERFAEVIGRIGFDEAERQLLSRD